jgi:hypothetical protein
VVASNGFPILPCSTLFIEECYLAGTGIRGRLRRGRLAGAILVAVRASTAVIVTRLDHAFVTLFYSD